MERTAVVRTLGVLIALAASACSGGPGNPSTAGSSGATGSSGSTSATSTTGSTGSTGTTIGWEASKCRPLLASSAQGISGYADGPPSQALFRMPAGAAFDAAGNLYVADSENDRIRVIDPAGNTSTLAGNGQFGLVDGSGGRGGQAEFGEPLGVTVDRAGVVYVADTRNNVIRRVDTAGNVTTFAGSNNATFVDGPSGSARFNMPEGVAVDAQGNVFVADANNARIRKIDGSGNVTTVAGNGAPGPSGFPGAFADGTGGPNGTASFFAPSSVAIDSHGDLFVADRGNNRIRRIDAQGNVTTFAGNGYPGFADGSGGPAGVAEFNQPFGLAFDARGNLLVADGQNAAIRSIDPSGNVTTVARTWMSAPTFCPGLENVYGVAVAPKGDLYATSPQGIIVLPAR